VRKSLEEQRREAERLFEGALARLAKLPDAERPKQAWETTGTLSPLALTDLPSWPEPPPEEEHQGAKRDAPRPKRLRPKRLRPKRLRPKRLVDRLVRREVSRAWLAVRKAAAAYRLRTVPTGLSAYPEARFDFSGGKAPDFAPLVATCLEPTMSWLMARGVMEARSRLTRARQEAPVDLYPGDDFRALMERVNRFLVTEAALWEIARTGGFEGPVPYPVRYWAARYLWSPEIAGCAFCLRCGDLIFYRRAGRRSGPRRRRGPVCDSCLRGGSLAWPGHAIMPHDRGRWWLRCRTCAVPFIGHGQARRCPGCRLNRLAPSRRPRAGDAREGPEASRVPRSRPA
jgi:hypothetical protein